MFVYKSDDVNHSVSVVIPNYNGQKLLEENLPSVFTALNNCCNNYEVIVADDASTDNSVSFLQSRYPEVILIQGNENGGFAINTNRGIAVVSKELVLLLNTDVKLAEDYFIGQFKYFDLQDTFGVMGKIISESGQIMDSAKYPLWKGAQIKSTVNYILKKEPPGFIYKTFFLSGANALINKNKLMQLGGINEIYSPFYMEDVDLSVRAWRVGWQCYYEPRAICTHRLSSTIKIHRDKKFIHCISKRNKFIFHHLHLEGSKRFRWKAETMANLLVRWMTFDFNYYKSYKEYKKLLPEISQHSKKLDELFKRMSVRKSLEEAVNEIIASIKENEKEVF